MTMIGLIEITRRKLQFALIALVIALIAYLILAINALGEGLNDSAAGVIENLNADAIAFNTDARGDLARSKLTAEQIDAVRSLEGVAAYGALSYSMADYRAGDGSLKSAGFFGVTPGTLSAPEVVTGRELRLSDTGAILADTAFLGASGLSVGDKVDFAVGLQRRTFEIVGEVNEGQLVFAPVVYMVQSAFADLQYGSDAAVAPPASVLLLRGENLTEAKLGGIEIRSRGAAYDQTLGGIRVTVLLLQGFAYAVGAAVIGVFFYVLTIQKVGQIGVLKALGASSSFVFWQLLQQVLMVAVLGLTIALPLGLLTGRLLESSAEGTPFVFSTATLVVTALAVFVTSVIGACFSAIRLIKTDPIIALGQQQ